MPYSANIKLIGIIILVISMIIGVILYIISKDTTKKAWIKVWNKILKIFPLLILTGVFVTVMYYLPQTAGWGLIRIIGCISVMIFSVYILLIILFPRKKK